MKSEIIKNMSVEEKEELMEMVKTRAQELLVSICNSGSFIINNFVEEIKNGNVDVDIQAMLFNKVLSFVSSASANGNNNNKKD
ncbi:MAG: hypothetical protein LBG48_04405 [Rickettsiales bacterium]|jgi:hypothetical protein|nr:hypothetical protein [Rickettsiales bacterium]